MIKHVPIDKILKVKSLEVDVFSIYTRKKLEKDV